MIISIYPNRIWARRLGSTAIVTCISAFRFPFNFHGRWSVFFFVFVFFFSVVLFTGIRRIRKELEKVIVRNNHDKLETLINSDTPKRGKGKSNKPRKVRHKQKPKGTPYFSRRIRAHAHTDRLDMSTCCNNLKKIRWTKKVAYFAFHAMLIKTKWNNFFNVYAKNTKRRHHNTTVEWAVAKVRYRRKKEGQFFKCLIRTSRMERGTKCSGNRRRVITKSTTEKEVRQRNNNNSCYLPNNMWQYSNWAMQ